MKKLTTEQFVKLAKAIYGEPYDYSDTKYDGSKKNVKILCKGCQLTFDVTPNNHLNPHNFAGCPRCEKHKVPAPRLRGRQKTKTSLSFADFVARSRLMHGDEYEYDENTYTKLTSKVEILHNKCNTRFLQRGTHHVGGQRCPKCYKRCFVSRKETAWLDLECIPESCRNVWIALSSGRRVNVDALYDNTVYEFYGTKIHADPRVYDPLKWSKLHGRTMGEVHASTLEREAAITTDGYKLVTMWELDWDSLV